MVREYGTAVPYVADIDIGTLYPKAVTRMLMAQAWMVWTDDDPHDEAEGWA